MITFVSASWVVVADIFRMVAGGERVNRVRIRIWEKIIGFEFVGKDHDLEKA